jgi:hypothetical protein
VTNGGSGYRSLCSRARSVASCDDCPSRTSPEYSFCATYVADDGKPCGEWQAGFSCDEPPCCESCLVLPNPPYPPSPTRTCVPTLDAAEETSGYGKTSRISGPPPSWWGAIAWSEGWESEHAGCNLVWVEDYVQQTTATGTYCNDWSYQQIHPDLVGVYVPPAGCYMLGTNIWCPTYTIRFWVRKRLFLVDCRDRTLREVTDEALAVPIEWTGCNVPAKYECGGGFCWYTPLCDTGTGNYCLGSNPGFLNAQPTLECGE